MSKRKKKETAGEENTAPLNQSTQAKEPTPYKYEPFEVTNKHRWFRLSYDCKPNNSKKEWRVLTCPEHQLNFYLQEAEKLNATDLIYEELKVIPRLNLPTVKK